jgi:DNA polymerase I
VASLDNVDLRLVDSVSEAMEFLRFLSEPHDGDLLAIDTESSGLHAFLAGEKLRLIQIGDKRSGWVIPWEQWGGVALEAVRKWRGGWILHNSPHDYQWLSHHAGVELPWNRIHDTMVQVALVDPLKPKGLKPVSERLFGKAALAGQKALKDAMTEQGWTWGTVPFSFMPYVIYSALDPVLTSSIHEEFYPQVLENASQAYDLERGAQRVCTRMMQRGMLLDVPYVNEAQDKLAAYSEKAREWLKSRHGITSPNSAGQIRRVLEGLGQEILFFTDAGAPQFDKSALEFYKNSGENQVVRRLIECILQVRHAEKIIGSYFSNFLELRDPDDIIHASINTLAARTGRMSITNPALQTLHREDKIVRGSFIPRPGHVFITCDLDQVEARFAAHFSGDEGLIKAFYDADNGGTDFFCGIASSIFGEPIIKGDPRRTLTKNTVYGCVPLTTPILTKRGWLSHDQVVIGDETIGYDEGLGASRWTRVVGVHRYPSAPLVELHNSHVSFVATPDHRWYGEQRHDTGKGGRIWKPCFRTTDEIGPETRVLLSAPLQEAQGVPITDDEAAILGWLLSDGDLQINYEVGGNAQAAGTRRQVQGQIRQSVKKHAVIIDELLGRASIPCTRHVRDGQYVTWLLKSARVRELIQRAGSFYDTWPDPVAFAASLSSSQASAMLEAMQLADGYNFIKTKQWQLDLVAALVYMRGQVPREKWEEPTEGGWSRKPSGRIFPTRPILTGSRLKRNSLPNAPVWCVTTELGTWTMRQDGPNGRRTVLTGNSIYGAGAGKMAETAGVPLETMEPIKEVFDRRFPGLKRLSADVTREALKNNPPSILSPLGRRLVADHGREFTQVTNSLIQGSAAETMKTFLLNIEAAGLGEYMCLPVHDEVICEVPAEMAEEAKRVIEQCMSNVTDFRVPITSGASILTERWKKT